MSEDKPWAAYWVLQRKEIATTCRTPHPQRFFFIKIVKIQNPEKVFKKFFFEILRL